MTEYKVSVTTQTLKKNPDKDQVWKFHKGAVEFFSEKYQIDIPLCRTCFDRNFSSNSDIITGDPPLSNGRADMLQEGDNCTVFEIHVIDE